MFGNANLIAGPGFLTPPDDAVAASSRQPGSSPLRSAIVFGTRAYLAMYHRLSVFGRENLPTHGPFVMVSNHASHLDAICLRSILPDERQPTAYTAVADDYFSASLLRWTAATWFANSVPISRRVHVRDGMRQCRSLLSGSQSVLIYFLEGTRSRDGRLASFRPGIGGLLAGSPMPVIPCAVKGSFRAWPKGRRLARPLPLRVVIGRPRSYADLCRTRQSHHAVADDLRSAVEELLCN